MDMLATEMTRGARRNWLLTVLSVELEPDRASVKAQIERLECCLDEP